MAGTIVELLAKPRDAWALDDLHLALQNAVILELATIPPYLCAKWSIADQGSPVAVLIDGVVREEMIHMALAGNILRSIGGAPALVGHAPGYPGQLPGGVHPELTVALSGLTRELVFEVFMDIEKPEWMARAGKDDTYPTIGAFYNAIAEALRLVRPTFGGQNQISMVVPAAGPPGSDYGSGEGPHEAWPIGSLDDAVRALLLIKEQGEGTSTSPDDDFDHELAHYYRFGEIHYGRSYLRHPDGRWAYDGPTVPFPAVRPVVVPPPGYPDPNGLLGACNAAYGDALDALEAAWSTGHGGFVPRAVGAMFSLQAYALEFATTGYIPSFLPPPIPQRSPR